MPLSMGQMDGSYKVISMDLPHAVEKRLESLGLIPNTNLKVLNAKDHGVLIVKFRGTRFALGRNITENIEVEPLV